MYRRLRYGYAFRRIPLSRHKKYAIVDPEDYWRLRCYRWFYCYKTEFNSHANRAEFSNGKRKNVGMHKDVLKVPDGMVVDHINGNGLDNRKANLRPATMMQNSWNRRTRRGKNRFKGVTWEKGVKKWRAVLAHSGKYTTLGYFTDEIEAAKAYDEAAKKYQGEFAVLNFAEGSG